MVIQAVRYLKWLIDRSNHWIESQLFTPTLSGAAASCRLALGFACLLFFNFWYMGLSVWIGPDGPLNVDVTRFLIGEGYEGTGSMFRWSPLYYWESPIAQGTIMFVGTIACLVLMSGFGGRIVPIVVWALMLCILNRVSMIQSPGEILLCSLVPYLAIDNGWLTQASRVGFADNQKRWTAGLTVAMIRWHLILWLSVSLASHLSQEMWWNGTAVWKIIVNDQSSWLNASSFAESGWLPPMLGNLWLILHFGLIVCLIFRNLRPMALILAVFFWGGVYVLGGDLLYAIAGAAAMSCVMYESAMLVEKIQPRVASK